MSEIALDLFYTMAPLCLLALVVVLARFGLKNRNRF